MESIDPLGFEDREVTLPDVVWGWHDAASPITTTASSNTNSGPQETSVLELLGRTSLVLPAMSQPPSPSDSVDSPTRRKRSAVTSFFQGLKSSMGSGSAASQAPVAEQALPILAALESVSTSSKRSDTLTPLTADQRDVSAFRYGVDSVNSSVTHASSPSSSPTPSPPKHSPDGRTRHRVQSVSGCITPLDFRTDPVASSPDAPTNGHNRHRRSTKTTIQRHSLLAAVGPSTAYTAATPSSTDDQEEDALDIKPDPETSHANAGTRLHSLLDTKAMATANPDSDPDPEFQHPVDIECKTPRSLPPLASSPGKPPLTTSSSPRKMRQTLSAKDAPVNRGDLPVCAACGKRVYPTNASLALDAAHVVHRACFRCVSCQEPLTPANFHRISTGLDGARFVCTTHYVERLEAKQQNPEVVFARADTDPDVKIS